MDIDIWLALPHHQRQLILDLELNRPVQVGQGHLCRPALHLVDALGAGTNIQPKIVVLSKKNKVKKYSQNLYILTIAYIPSIHS